MSRDYKFKDKEYDLETLYCYHMDKRLDGFEEGEVIHNEDGEVFDIKDIKNYRHLLNKNLIKNASHLSYPTRRRIFNALSDDERKTLEEEFVLKIDSNSITLEELKVYMELINSEANERGGVPYSFITDNFIKLNQSIKIPSEISDATLGKFYRLLNLVTYKNTVNTTNHGNSNKINKLGLMEYLGIKNEKTFRTSFAEMEKYSLLHRKENKGRGFTILINPIYANRDDKFSLNCTMYDLFKESLDLILPKYIIKYFELENKSNGLSIDIDE